MPLDNIPSVKNLIGIENLRTASMIIAGLGVGSPILLLASFCAGMSFLVISIWILMVAHMVFSSALLYALFEKVKLISIMWLWYTIVYVPLLFLLFCFLLFIYVSRRSYIRVFATLIGMVYILGTILSIFVINTYRMEFENKLK